jgi:hypothetical protein
MAAIFKMSAKTHQNFKVLQFQRFSLKLEHFENFTHFGGHLKNGCQNDRHFEIASGHDHIPLKTPKYQFSL